MSSIFKKNIVKLYDIEKKLESLRVGYIVSTGRTGTNFFEQFLNDNFTNTTSLHEPAPDHFHLATKYIRKSLTDNELRYQFLYGRIKQVKAAYKRKHQHYIESNPNIAVLAPTLNKIYNQPKVLHIIRHPDTYIKSAINKDPGEDGNLFLTDGDHRKRLNSDDFVSDPLHGKWSTLNQYQRICWHWAFTNKYLYENLSSSKNYLLIKFEDLFKDNKEESLNIIIDFFGLRNNQKNDIDTLLSTLSNKRNNTQSIKIGNLNKLKQENTAFYNKVITPELLSMFGY